MGMLAAAAASTLLASPQAPAGRRRVSGAWTLRLRPAASPGAGTLRLHNFVPKCYIANIEVDVSTVSKEEDFDDPPSLPPGCSIPVVNLRGDVLDSSPFSLHDRASCPSDFEELPVLSEGEQHTLASTPAHPAGLYALYASYLFGNLVEQLWNFAWPAALAILHPSLLPVAIVGFFTKLSVFIGAPIVGKLMDHFPRIPMYTALNAVQVATQLISAATVIYALKNLRHASTTAVVLRPWFISLVAAGAIERLAGLALGVSMERDWVVLLAGTNRPVALAQANAVLNRLDLICETVGASVFGLLLSKYHPVTCLKIACGLMICSFPVLVMLGQLINRVSCHALDSSRTTTDDPLEHCRAVNGCHNKARKCADDFSNQRTSISRKIESNTIDYEKRYEVRMTAALDIARFLIAQGHAFRGHDESATSLNKGNFLEMLDWYKKRNNEVRAAFDDWCPKNAKMTSPEIQKALTESCAKEISKVIKDEIGDNLFSVLIDESRDISIAEQMAVIVRFVNKDGMIVERFLGLKHVEDTTSNALKKSLLEMLAKYGLSVARLRGQGYDGASNMRGEFNGLQKQIRDENPYAFYVHCFAHQLQLVIVSVTSSCSSFDDFFNYVSLIVTSASSSCKRKDKLNATHQEEILKKLETGEIFSGKGKHQRTNLVRPGETRWGSHLTTLARIETMWNSVVKVLSMIHEDERNTSRAGGLVRKMESFSFVLNMKLMLKVLRITNELSQLLQRKDQNIVQAMSLLVDVKTRLMSFRNEGWEPLLREVKSFCTEKKIPIPNMDDSIPRWGRSRLDGNLITQEHHYRVDTFLAAIDAIITEMDHRFNEVSSELLVCFSCLDPRDSFSKFDVEKIARLTEIYKEDFSDLDRSNIRDQLETFILHMRRVEQFKACHDFGSLAIQMVKSERDIAFPIVYRLIKLGLLLPVATATVERAFSAMNIIKTDLRNKMSDEWLNDLILCYIEKEIFRGLDESEVRKTFQASKNRAIDLPRPPRRPRHD